jgi:hypothetical protein
MWDWGVTIIYYKIIDILIIYYFYIFRFDIKYYVTHIFLIFNYIISLLCYNIYFCIKSSDKSNTVNLIGTEGV